MQPIRIVEVSDVEELCSWSVAWDDLARRALEANCFYEREALLPALEELCIPEGWRVLLVLDPRDSKRLIGLLPLSKSRLHPALPTTIWRSLQHIYGFSTVPLIDRDQAQSAIDGLLNWVEEKSGSAVDLVGLVTHGQLWSMLQGRLKRHEMPRAVHNNAIRAAIRPCDDGERYIASALRKKRRKELSRQWRRLGELGSLEIRWMQRGEDPSPWIRDLLQLEAGGWKGRRGTAFAAQEDHERYFERLVRRLHGDGRVEMGGLFLDGRPIALKCNLLSAGTPRVGFAFRIAYDEAYEAYSPGVQLELEQIRRLHREDAQADWMDSCASASHFMINRLWSERLRLASILIAPSSIKGRSMVAAFECGGALHRRYGRKNVDITGVSAMSSTDTLLAFDRTEFQRCYPERHFRCTHRLVDHPLLRMEALLELSRRLPETSIEYNAGNLAVSQDPSSTPANGLSAEETIQRIRDNRSWLVLKYVEQDPAYATLIKETLKEVIELAEPVTPGVDKLEGYIFVSSPGSVTPYHVDNEHNFLLQICGSKTMHAWHRDDREVLSEEELEVYHSGGHRNLTYDERYTARCMPYELQPGEGVFQPVTAPHWVQNGDDVSISLSVTFRSESSVREAELYRLNHRLRGLGITPAPVGTVTARDSAKYLVARAERLGRRVLRLG